MEVKNYCLIVIENTKGLKSDIIKIAEGRPRLLDTPSFALATFSSAFDVNELKELFSHGGRSVIIFEIEDGKYGALLNDKLKHDFVFGHIQEFGKEIAKDMTDKLVGSYLSDTKEKVSEEKEDIDITKLTEEEKMQIRDAIYDKGYENIDDEDKKMLEQSNKQGEHPLLFLVLSVYLYRQVHNKKGKYIINAKEVYK